MESSVFTTRYSEYSFIRGNLTLKSIDTVQAICAASGCLCLVSDCYEQLRTFDL